MRIEKALGRPHDECTPVHFFRFLIAWVLLREKREAKLPR